MNQNFDVVVADSRHLGFVHVICEEMAASAKVRGTGIAKRSPEYLTSKIQEGKAVIAFAKDGSWAGFCYIESWSHGEYVANSGLIVSPVYRKSGVAKLVEKRIFELSRKRYPNAKLFGLTTGLAVMKINSELGYTPVTYSELTQDDTFWQGCRSCVNYDILMSKERKNCLCTAMLYNPEAKAKQEENARHFSQTENVHERLLRLKPTRFLKLFYKKSSIKSLQNENSSTSL